MSVSQHRICLLYTSIVENDGTWAHIKSGNVDGYVNVSYCMTGTDALKMCIRDSDGGDVYTNAVVSYMKKNIGYETVKNLYSQYSSLNENKSARCV